MSPEPRPILYLFAISHYCEKARWALDRFGIDYEPRFVMPGMNRTIGKKLGASSGSLPFMQAGDGVIAGSGAIIDWGDTNRAPGHASLAGDDHAAVRALERRLDDVLGVHVRRYYYSDALITDPGSVRPIFSRDLPFFQKIAVTVGWPKIVPRMIKLMDLGPAQGLASRDIVMDELDWLDSLLGDGRPFLAGSGLTRADITAASLLAPFVTPAEHPVYHRLALPSQLAHTVASWQGRPSLKWVKQVYTDWR
jgi:glutathione S-transferase